MNPAMRMALPVACLVALTGMVGGDPAPQPGMELSKGLQGTFNADWQGVAGRTYFTQFSHDLVIWHYAPFIDFGDGGHHRGIECDAGRIFLRLDYGDYSGITSLDQAMAADFDEDGLTSIFEVTHGYDPFDGDSTLDGPDAELDPDDDGLGNLSEAATGSDPMAKDHPVVALEVAVD
jgi:hypothetical protein